MLPGVLPREYEIPKFHGPSDIRFFEDNSYFLLKPDSKGVLTIEGEDGTFIIKDREDILKLFKSRYNWTFSRLNEWEAIFKFFNSDQLFNLLQVHTLDFGTHTLYWIHGTDKIRLTERGFSRSSKFLINVAPRVLRDYQVDTLDKLRDIVRKIIWQNQYLPINITSPASTTKDLLLTVGYKEFTILNKIPMDIVRFLHTYYIGPRMESQCLGTIDNVDNLDMEKAYLRALRDVPSIARGNLLKIVRGAPLDKYAHPGSGYEIEVEVPPTYGNFAPAPYKNNGHTQYPYGRFRTKVTKPYLDLFDQLGDVHYTILDSVQFILIDPKKKPFKEFAKGLEDFENILKEPLYPLNLKTLHYTLQGHMLHIHKNVDLKTGDVTYETSQDYNPIDASAIQAMVAVELFLFSLRSNTEAIRVDALSGYNLNNREGYKREESGLMTFLTPYLKDKPGSTLYRDLIHNFRDHPGILVKFPVRFGLKGSWFKPKRIGALKTEAIELVPLGGNRGLEDIKKIGELLDRRVTLPIPLCSMDHPQGSQISIREGNEWVDEYLRLFPQTRI